METGWRRWTADPVPVEPAVTVKATPRSPAAVARYEVTFTNGVEDLEPQHQDAIVMTLDEDIRVPRLILPPAVQVRFRSEEIVEAHRPRQQHRHQRLWHRRRGGPGPAGRPPQGYHPDHLSRHSRQRRRRPPQPIPAGATVTVIFTRQAGLSNPTEGGAFPWKVSTTKDPAVKAAAHPEEEVRQAFGEPEGSQYHDNTEADLVTGLLVDWEVQLSHEGVSRGNEVTVIGRGYKNGTTLTFWRDANFDGRRDSGENELCRVEVGGNDIGVCSFTVSNPPFVAGFGDCASAKRYAGGYHLQLRQRGGRPEPTLNPGPRWR